MEASKIKQYFLGENLSSLAPVAGKKVGHRDRSE